MGFVADILGFGNAAGPHFDFDYSTATGAGITNMTQANLASTAGVASIIYASADSQSVVLRSDVDVDPIATDGYPRSEFREKASNGTTDRAFTDTTGDHMIETLHLPMHLPPVNPAYVLLQEHDSSQDLMEIVVKARSDYATTGKLEVALKLAIGGSSTSSGIPRFIADYGTLAELITKPKWLNSKIRTGLIGPGATAGWSATVNGVTLNSWDAGMLTRDASVANTCYYKTGMYLQTKWTGSGSPGHTGVETDRNEYGEAAWRSIKVTHNGESLPFIPVTGSRVEDTISNVRWGAKAEGDNAAQPTALTLTPALPASLVKDDMVYVVARTRRTGGSGIVSSPAIESVSPQWSRFNLNSGTTEFVSTAGNVPGDLTSHSQRMRIWCRPWFSGMAAPVLTYSSTTATDIMSAQCFAIYGGKLGIAAEVIDQIPTNFNFGATSTTVLGPTAALPADAEAGSLALALLANEFNVTSGAATTVSGDGLTWVEGGEGIGTTIAFQAWANDHAIVPATAGQAITAKQSANTAHTTGKSASALLTLKRAKKHRHGNRIYISG